MDDGPNTKVAPFWRAELSRPTGIPQVRYKDVPRRDLKAYDVTIQMKALCLYFLMMLFVCQNFRKRNVEIWPKFAFGHI